MSDVLDRIRKELDARLEQLRPFVEEFERLQRAAVALARSGARAVPGVGAPASAAAGRTGQPRRRRASVPPRTPAAVTAVSEPKTAVGERPLSQDAPRRATQVRAARGQTQAKVLAALRQTPGARTATIASTTGLPTKAASATISRLVKQGRVRRLPQGGYALAEAASNGTETQAAQATTDAGPAATGSEEGARSVRVETRPPEADTPRRR